MATTNPFEPPRTTDLDGSEAPVHGPLIVSARALQELIGATPWVRRLARLTVASIAIQLLTLGAVLAHRRGLAAAIGAVGVSALNIGVWVLFLVVLRRYAAASARLGERGVAAIGPVIAAQARYMKLAGIITMIAASVILGRIAFGIGSGAFLSWVYR